MAMKLLLKRAGWPETGGYELGQHFMLLGLSSEWGSHELIRRPAEDSGGLLQVSRMILASWKVLGTRVHKTFHQAQIFHDKGRQLAIFVAYIHVFRAGHRGQVPSAIRCRDRGSTLTWYFCSGVIVWVRRGGM